MKTSIKKVGDKRKLAQELSGSLVESSEDVDVDENSVVEIPKLNHGFDLRSHKLSSFQRMLVYEAVELGLSHNCAGIVFGVRSVPRIVRRIKLRLAC